MIRSKYNPGKVKPTNNILIKEDKDGEIDGKSTTHTMINSCVPRMWESNIAMDSYLDCGMHLIFQGIAADIVELAGSFMSDHGLESKFTCFVNQFLLDIQSLWQSWSQMKYFQKDKWLAEDDLGLSCIIPFI